jgi:hypothetical protein
MMSFYEMERRLGTVAAYYCLLEIERAARIRSGDVAEQDLETRLQNACRAQDAMLQADKVA